MDCLDTNVALDYWRPIKEKSSSPDLPRDALAIELVSCLASPDAELRDQIGYELFTLWLRDDRLSDATRTTLLLQLSALMSTPPASLVNDAALGRSFSALILAELMRSDAHKPFMSEPQRRALLTDTIAALERENDFRGLDPAIGWVHPVAHMSDLLWRFALHPDTSSAQAERILVGITTKVAPTTTFYHFNESDRLARVASTIISRELVDTGLILEWIEAFESPQSIENWSSAFSSSAGMAELHNTKLFLRALSDQLTGTDTRQEIIERLDKVVSNFTRMI